MSFKVNVNGVMIECDSITDALALAAVAGGKAEAPRAPAQPQPSPSPRVIRAPAPPSPSSAPTHGAGSVSTVSGKPLAFVTPRPPKPIEWWFGLDRADQTLILGLLHLWSANGQGMTTKELAAALETTERGLGSWRQVLGRRVLQWNSAHQDTFLTEEILEQTEGQWMARPRLPDFLLATTGLGLEELLDLLTAK